jgi:glutaminase
MSPTPLQSILNEACESVRPLVGTGKVANYIPALANINGQKFGAAIIKLDGEVAYYGDYAERFSIQSISKVFALTSALNLVGHQLWERIHHEPSGNAFNSIVQLEMEQGIPRNPFINAGALVTIDILLQDLSPTACIDAIVKFIRSLGQDESIGIDEDVARSELATAHRNASLAHFMKSFNNLKHDIADILEVYCHFCALSMSCQQVARAFLYLANEGTDPVTGQCIISEKRARRIKSIMMLCGHYDASGDFAFRVGLPGKSGVGGGIVAIVPKTGVVCVWSPGLNGNGNSLVGTAALEALARKTGWNIF